MDNSSDSAFALGSNASNETCKMYRGQLLEGTPPYVLLSFLTPLDDQLWTERSLAWNVLFKVYSAVFAFLFLVVALHAVALIVRRECIRMKTKTFFAVYTCIAVLGFSRFLLLVLDPFGLIGFIADHFGKWIIFSRILAVLGFPSLVASYTMVFLTLIKIANASLRKQWYQKWKCVLPIALVPYVIAIGGEVLAHVAPYPLLISVLACESLFAVWGTVLSITYLFAGFRLLRSINRQQKRTVKRRSITVQSDLETNAERVNQREAFQNEEFQRRKRGIQTTTRKIAIITNVTAVTGLFYSLANAVNLIILSLFVFKSCFGFMGERGNSTAWLIMQVGLKSLEVALAANMFYSITDMRALLTNVRRMLLCRHRCCCCCGGRSRMEDSSVHSSRSTTRTFQANNSLASMSTSLALAVAESRMEPAKEEEEEGGVQTEDLAAATADQVDPLHDCRLSHQSVMVETVEIRFDEVSLNSGAAAAAAAEEEEEEAAKMYVLDAQTTSSDCTTESSLHSPCLTDGGSSPGSSSELAGAEATETFDEAVVQREAPATEPAPKPRTRQQPTHLPQHLWPYSSIERDSREE